MTRDAKNTVGRCACGCWGETTLHQGKYRRFLMGHKSRKSGAMFLIKEAGYRTPCWIWQLGKDRGGYGVVKSDGKSSIAHRNLYIMANGPVEPGLELDHLCRNRDCVRPDHLEAVTKKVNCRRGHGTVFAQEIIEKIFLLKAEGVRNFEISALLGVSRQHVGNILKGARRVG